MKITYEKADDYSIIATKILDVEPIVNTYDMAFLKQQVINITTQRDAFVDARNTELDEVNAMIDEAEKLGITEKPIQAIEPIELIKP